MSNFVSAAYHPDLLTVEFTNEDGDHYLRSGGTIAWRFNNPGNLRPGPKYTRHIGRGTTKSGEFLIFPTVEAGRAEKKGLLLRKYQDDTLKQMMEQYAPRSENDTDAYLAYLSKKSGIDKGAVIGKLSQNDLDALMDAMESYEGYHAKKETRKEKWVRATKVTLSDGARPIAGQAVTVKLGATSMQYTTNAFGELPAIAHTTPGEQVELLIRNVENKLERLDCFALGDASQNLTYVRNFMVAQGSTRPHIASTAPEKKKPGPFSYVVQPNDTLGKIAENFKSSSELIQKANSIRDPNKILPGQRLWIHGVGESSAPAANTTTNPTSDINSPLATISERSKEGQGQPLGIIPVDQKRAPWMMLALAEAKTWGKVDEKEITKTRNYHKLVSAKGGLNSLAGDSNPWCASFANWCLLKAGYRIAKPPAKSRAFEKSQDFRKISEPVYGAIAVFKRGRSSATGHVCFVYSRSKTTGHIVVLGGNQGDKITFESRSEKNKLVGFFVPKTYEWFANQEIKLKTPLLERSASELNLALGIVIHKKNNAKDS